jgi:hypothetical protein
MTIHSLFDLFLSWFKPKPKPKPKSEPEPISTTIIVRVGDKVVGAIQSLSITEKKELDGKTSVTAKISRVRFDKMRISEAFSRGFLHVKSQMQPFDIEIIDNLKVTTVLKNVWITSLDYTYSANDWIIIDYMEVEAETIYSYKVE